MFKVIVWFCLINSSNQEYWWNVIMRVGSVVGRDGMNVFLVLLVRIEKEIFVIVHVIIKIKYKFILAGFSDLGVNKCTCGGADKNRNDDE